MFERLTKDQWQTQPPYKDWEHVQSCYAEIDRLQAELDELRKSKSVPKGERLTLKQAKWEVRNAILGSNAHEHRQVACDVIDRISLTDTIGVDNPDGTTTYILKTTVPKLPEWERPSGEVRAVKAGERFWHDGTRKVVDEDTTSRPSIGRHWTESAYLILAPREPVPTWSPIVHLREGEWSSDGWKLAFHDHRFASLCHPLDLIPGWTNPPPNTRWRIDSEGVAHYLGRVEG